MSYLKLSTMQYPLHEGDIRLEHPEIREDQTGDTFPVPVDFVKVKDIPRPKFDFHTQYVSMDTPILVDGEWQQAWVIKEFTPEEIEQRKAAVAP